MFAADAEQLTQATETGMEDVAKTSGKLNHTTFHRMKNGFETVVRAELLVNRVEVIS